MTTAPEYDPVASLQATRRAMRRARLQAADALDEARRTWHHHHDTLEHVRNWKERQWWLRIRRSLSFPFQVLRHPGRTLRRTAGHLLHATRFHRLGPIAEQAFWISVPLRGYPPAHQQTDQPA